MKYLFLRLLPKNLFSRLLGVLSDAKLPSPFLLSLILIYCRVYKIRRDELKVPLSRMKTFNDFFTRELKRELRPIDQASESVVSPVDGTVAEFGAIEQGLLVQTKGVLYSLSDLVGTKDAELFEKGYFVTVYLSPADYHRIHTPVAGKVRRFSYFSGNLWPVNGFGVSTIGGLFSLNERIVTPIESEHGVVALVKVGATIVGKISLDYSEFCSNSGKNTQINLPIIPGKKYGKGDEIGRFQLGSTIILLFEKDRFIPVDLFSGKKVQMGQAIGRFKSSSP
ncbi:MAG: phosphatidylserine decarboxylase [Proteobacteria bacterium]|nr:phosphatidylserine decarboxylase [Pseudomonadota bacterium]